MLFVCALWEVSQETSRKPEGLSNDSQSIGTEIHCEGIHVWKCMGPVVTGFYAILCSGSFRAQLEAIQGLHLVILRWGYHMISGIKLRTSGMKSMCTLIPMMLLVPHHSFWFALMAHHILVYINNTNTLHFNGGQSTISCSNFTHSTKLKEFKSYKIAFSVTHL